MNTEPRFYLGKFGMNWHVYDRDSQSVWPQDVHLIVVSCSDNSGHEEPAKERAEAVCEVLNVVNAISSRSFSPRAIETLERLVATKRAEYLIDAYGPQYVRSAVQESPSYDRLVEELINSGLPGE